MWEIWFDGHKVTDYYQLGVNEAEYRFVPYIRRQWTPWQVKGYLRGFDGTKHANATHIG